MTAYDQSTVGLKKTRILAGKINVNIDTVEVDLTKEKVEVNQYDAAIMVFGHVPKKDQQFLLESMMGSVKPGGLIMFEVYSEDQLDYQTGGPKSVEMLYNPVDIIIYPHRYNVNS